MSAAALLLLLHRRAEAAAATGGAGGARPLRLKVGVGAYGAEARGLAGATAAA